MKHSNSLSFLIAGLTVLMAGCNISEINDPNHIAGTPIVFSASTGYENGAVTRAEFSGKLYGGASDYERIDWETNDPIKIVYNGGGATYTVSSVTGTTDRNSYAQLSSANGLLWESSPTHVFYGLYPAGANGSISNNGVVNGSIPAAQTVDANHTLSVDGITKYQPDTDNHGYMVAYRSLSSSEATGAVQLPFKPAMTAFEFKFQLLPDTAPLAIRSVTLSTEAVNGTTTPLAGNFTFQITGGDSDGATWNKAIGNSSAYTQISGASNSVTLTFPVSTFPSGAALPSSGFLDFSILTLPVDITGLSITINYADGTTPSKTLQFKDNRGTANEAWHSFPGAKKYVITNTVRGADVWHFVIEEINDITTYGYTAQSNLPFTVKSYKWNDREGSAVKYPVPWKIQYQDGSSWTDVASNGSTGANPHTISGGVTGNGGTAGEGRYANITGTAQSVVVTANDIKTEMAQRSARGTSSSPWDLSMHDIFGEAHSMTTANTYVIDHPGWYMFPVAYGNGITNGAINANAYRPGEGGDQYVTLSSIYSTHFSEANFRYFRDFFDAAGGGINDPRILTSYHNWPGSTDVDNMDAVIVWQNSMTGARIVQETSPSLLDVETSLGTIKYIKFEVKAADIQPGNVVIAFRGTVNGRGLTTKTILWSWQLWFTQNDLHASTIGSASFMPRNLGAVDKPGYTSYADRRLQYRIVQTEGDAVEEFLVEEIGPHDEAGFGSNPYYQWGRKDPMVPADPGTTNSTTKVVAGNGYSDYASYLYVNATDRNAHTAIQYPHRPVVNVGYSTWIGGADHSGADNLPNQACLPYNLWNAAIYKYMDAGGANKYKTVYDPCPPGFCVPNLNAYSGFTSATFGTEGATFGEQYFPYSGLRVYNQGALDTGMIGAAAYSWTDCPDDTSSNHQFAQDFCFSTTTIYNPVVLGFHLGDCSFTRVSGLAIRPMVDPKY